MDQREASLMMSGFWSWLAVHTGTYIPAGQYSPYYNFLSGFGSILERLIELIVIGLIIYWHHTCHVTNCPKPGRFVVQGTPYKVCKKHHPTVPDGDITMRSIRNAHDAAQRR